MVTIMASMILAAWKHWRLYIHLRRRKLKMKSMAKLGVVTCDVDTKAWAEINPLSATFILS